MLLKMDPIKGALFYGTVMGEKTNSSQSSKKDQFTILNARKEIPF
jgi:hypothetical protein